MANFRSYIVTIPAFQFRTRSGVGAMSFTIKRIPFLGPGKRTQLEIGLVKAFLAVTFVGGSGESVPTGFVVA